MPNRRIPGQNDLWAREARYEGTRGLRTVPGECWAALPTEPDLSGYPDPPTVDSLESLKAGVGSHQPRTPPPQMGPDPWQAITDLPVLAAGMKPRPYLAYLRRYSTVSEHRVRRGPPVLLIHGASAWRGTFMEPNGGFIKYLLHQEFDVWALDWRCSKVVTDPWRAFDPAQVPRGIVDMTLHDAAAGELPAAVRQVSNRSDGRPPIIVAHCMGAAITALAIAKGHLTTDGTGDSAVIARLVVLSTIGLFYRTGVDSWFRANERFDGAQPVHGQWYLYPGQSAWSGAFEDLFTVWRKMPYPACKIPFCQRLSALLGAPYRPNDIGYLHDFGAEEDLNREITGLAGQFGVMPLSFLFHCAQNVRRGWVAPRNASDSDDSDLNLERFANVETVLISGTENQLWYRDSIDRMYEWLVQEKATVHKVLFDQYGHQDLWWSTRSSERDGVYDEVKKRIDAFLAI